MNQPSESNSASPAAAASPAGTPLTRLVPGTCAMISCIIAADDDVSRLMAMGVCVGRKIEIVKAGNPLILRVLGSRLGVSARLANLVLVDSCVEPTCRPPTYPST